MWCVVFRNTESQRAFISKHRCKQTHKWRRGVEKSPTVVLLNGCIHGTSLLRPLSPVSQWGLGITSDALALWANGVWAWTPSWRPGSVSQWGSSMTSDAPVLWANGVRAWVCKLFTLAVHQDLFLSKSEAINKQSSSWIFTLIISTRLNSSLFRLPAGTTAFFVRDSSLWGDTVTKQQSPKRLHV